MANQVRVTSLDALEHFRAELIVFLSKAKGAIEEVGDEVRRTRNWFSVEQKSYWENQLRKRQRVLDQANQEYMSARLSSMRDNTAMQKQAVAKAKRAVEEAEFKLLKIKGWVKNFDGCVDPLVKRMSSLSDFLDFEMPKAIAYLVQAQKTLEEYTQIPTPDAGAAAAAGSGEESSPPA